MPLVLQAALAWALGLVLGFAVSAPGALLVTLGVTSALLLWCAGHARLPAGLEQWGALLMILAAAIASGSGARRADEACVAEAQRASRSGQRVDLLLLADAAPGAFLRATLVGEHCRVPVALSVRSGSAAAGSVVAVRGAELSEGDRGLMLRDGRVSAVQGPGPLSRWRARVAARLDRLFGPDGPMVRALLIADTRGMDPTLRDRYADAGLVHMLSISGLHVAIVGGALLLLLGAARLPAVAASSAAVAITALYVLAIGAPAPAVRSATLFAATQLSRLWQRPVSPWGSFALGAMLPLVDPRTVLDLGYQLSVSGYAAIIVAGRLARRLPRLRGWRETLSRELVAGVLSTLATSPLVAWHFGRLSLVAPITNLFAGPVISLLQPTLFAAMLLPESFGAAFVADAARPLLRAMDAIAQAGASLPAASVPVAPSLSASLLAGTAVMALLVAAWSRDWARPAIVSGVCVSLLLWWPTGLRPRTTGMELHLLDVGQGDAIAMRTPRGRWVLVDAGRSWKSGDAGRAMVIPYLRRYGGELALMVLTHPHADHIGGATSVIRALRPAELRDAAFVEGSEGYRALLAEAQARGTRWQRVRPGEQMDVDGVLLEFLAPDSVWTASLDDPNEASTVLRATYGNTRVLLTGDAESAEERWLLERDPTALRADVLKVAHHGSRTSSGEAFVRAVAPRVALVSVGPANGYGHPSSDVMRRLLDAGALLLRTDQLGTVVLHSDGRRLEVEAAGQRWPVTQPLP